MKDFIIKINDNYEMPDNLRNIAELPWDNILTNISELIVICDNLNDALCLDINSIEKRTSLKYINKINDLERRLDAQLKLADENKLERESFLEYKSNALNEIKQKYDAQISEIEAKNEIKLQSELTRVKDNAHADMKLLREQFEYFREKYNKLNESQNVEKEKLISAIKVEYDEIINKIKLSEEQKNAMQMAEMRKQFDEQMTAIKSQFKIQSDNQNNLIKTLDPIASYYSGNNIEKGNVGENCIFNLLINENAYKTAIIEDTSNMSASGDILLSWSHIRCMIEVKNKIKIDKEDISKFKRDVISMAETGKINCAILLSLKSSQFPGQSREIIQLDYINGTPVVYVYAPPPSNEIHAAIALLEKFTQSTNNSSKQQQELNSHFSNYYKMISDLLKNNYCELTKKQKEIKTINENITKYKILIDELSPTFARISQTDADVITSEETQLPKNISNDKVLAIDDDSCLKQLVDKFISFANSKTTTNVTHETLYNYYNYDDRVYKFDIDEIRKIATKIILDKRINDNHLETFNNFYKSTGRFPNKPAWKTMGILTDHYYKVITKISESDYHMTILIGNYCINRIIENKK